MFFFQVKSGTELFFACFLLLNILSSSTAQADSSENPSVSNSVASNICKQHGAFQEAGEIQTPVKAKPEDDDAACGWYSWSKCEDSKTESDSCPSFVLEACEEPKVPKTGRKGKGITIKQKQGKSTSTKQADDKCVNSSAQGLPNPQIVPSVSKYPSLVTIEQGDRCKNKWCTGIILDENWVVVLQSGCMWMWLQPKHQDYFDFVAGEQKLYVEDGTEQKRYIAEYIPHPGHNPREFHFYKDNIGLVRVSAPFELNENVQPVDLAAIEAMAPSVAKSILTIVGWTREQPLKEDKLQTSVIESPLDYFPIDECYDEKMKGDEAPKETLICAGRCPFYGEESNQPLRNVLFAQADSNSSPVPVGLGPMKHIDSVVQNFVFLNLGAYVPWIQEQMKGQGQGQGQGQTTESPESRIIRGEDAPKHKYKSIVNIEPITSYACSGHICGGTILNEEWFVTAAHCIGGSDPAGYRVFVGDHDLRDTDEDEQVVSMVEIVDYPKDNSTDYLNDIALVKVAPPFKFNDFVQKVTLPDPNFDPTGTLTAVGWGSDENLVSPHILKQGDIPVVPLEECRKQRENSTVPVDEGQICAGNDTHGICKGDSGGPLYSLDESGEQTLVGITSKIGTACDQNLDWAYDVFGGRSYEDDKPRGPGVFTRVSKYLDWIRKTTGMDQT